jgi:hypothetical protein
MQGWYGFFRGDGLMIGPFPMKDFHERDVLRLEEATNLSQHYVFGKHLDVFLSFEDKYVRIGGAGARQPKASPPAQPPPTPSDEAKKN